MVKAVYLAGNSYPHDSALEERVTHFLSARLGISTYPQSSLIPPPEQVTVDPLDPAVRLETLATLIDSIDEPVILIGRSSGGRIITQFAEKHSEKIAACICFGFPFQSPGQPPEDWRTKHLQTLSLPTLIIQGTRDRYGHENLYERFSLNPRTKILHVDADHESTYSEHDWLSITEAIERLIRFTTEQIVSKRCVFYLSGFDPRGARHYYELFKTELNREESAEAFQAISKRNRIEPHVTQWTVDTAYQDQSRSTHTEFRFLQWDDIARTHWPISRFKHWWRYVRVTPRYLLSGFFQKSSKLSTSGAAYLLSPNILIVLTGVICGLIAALCLWLGTSWITSATGQIINGAAGIAGCWLTWRVAHWFETTRKLDWIMRSYAFTARQAHDEVPEIDERLDDFADQIINRVQQNIDDEILIVGHSSGSMMAASALARAAERYPQLFEHSAKIGLLTLGQCLQMLGLLPRATKFRSELSTLATQRYLLWVDLSSVSDRICTPKANPFDACEVKRPPDGYGAQLCLISPPFYLLPTIAGAEIRNTAPHAAIFDLHFQYLRRFPTNGFENSPPIAQDYYLNIATQSSSLHRRFERLIPSPLPEGFHAATYLRLNPDVLQSGISAEEHYRRHGAREHRPFCISVPEDFDPALYLALNPDVAQAGIDPMIHYTLHGVQENRRYQAT